MTRIVIYAAVETVLTLRTIRTDGSVTWRDPIGLRVAEEVFIRGRDTDPSKPSRKHAHASRCIDHSRGAAGMYVFYYLVKNIDGVVSAMGGSYLTYYPICARNGFLLSHLAHG